MSPKKMFIDVQNAKRVSGLVNGKVSVEVEVEVK